MARVNSYVTTAAVLSGLGWWWFVGVGVCVFGVGVGVFVYVVPLANAFLCFAQQSHSLCLSSAICLFYRVWLGWLFEYSV